LPWFVSSFGSSAEPDWLPRRGRAIPSNFPAKQAEIAAQEAEGKDIELWFQDEARIGQKNKIMRIPTIADTDSDKLRTVILKTPDGAGA